MVQHGPYAEFATGKDAADAQPQTGISAIVVGAGAFLRVANVELKLTRSSAGIAGLACAVELKLNGHSPVTVYDSVPKFARLGE